MENSERYLDAYARIEKRLRADTGLPRSAAFSEMVRRAAERSSAVRAVHTALNELGDLRNAIVHERSDGHVIAEPNDVAVCEIERIATLLISPPKVMPEFQRKVACAEAAWSVGRALKQMNRRAYSQLPVTEDSRVSALLTANTITRWLAVNADDDLVSLTETTVGEVLEHAETPENFALLGRDAPLSDALEAFEEHEKRGAPLDAVLITAHGRRSEGLLGIATAYDIGRMHQELTPEGGRRRR